MKRISFLVLLPCALLIALPRPAAGESQTWKLRPGDSIETIATTLEIPGDALRKHNPGIAENNLQIGQRLKLPLRSYAESRALELDLQNRNIRIGDLERQNNFLENQIAAADAQLRWHPLWFYGFWIFFSALAFIAAGAYWLFRQTHPRVFDEPQRDRSIRAVKESKVRARSFPYDEENAGDRSQHWHPPLKRLPHGH